MHSEVILLKYLRQLRRCGADNVSGGYRHMDAVELAFRLAFGELEENMATADAFAELGAANLRIMELQADVERLTDELRIARNGTGLAIKNPPFAPGPGDNLQSPISNLDSPPNPPPAPLPLDLSSLAPDELDQVVAVQSGERAWRTLDKPLRMKVARLTLRQLSSAQGSLISMRDWDEQRPPWMPTQGAICQMFKCKWHEITQE